MLLSVTRTPPELSSSSSRAATTRSTYTRETLIAVRGASSMRSSPAFESLVEGVADPSPGVGMVFFMKSLRWALSAPSRSRLELGQFRQQHWHELAHRPGAGIEVQQPIRLPK